MHGICRAIKSPDCDPQPRLREWRAEGGGAVLAAAPGHWAREPARPPLLPPPRRAARQPRTRRRTAPAAESRGPAVQEAGPATVQRPVVAAAAAVTAGPRGAVRMRWRRRWQWRRRPGCWGAGVQCSGNPARCPLTRLGTPLRAPHALPNPLHRLIRRPGSCDARLCCVCCCWVTGAGCQCAGWRLLAAQPAKGLLLFLVGLGGRALVPHARVPAAAPRTWFAAPRAPPLTIAPPMPPTPPALRARSVRLLSPPTITCRLLRSDKTAAALCRLAGRHSST